MVSIEKIKNEILGYKICNEVIEVEFCDYILEVNLADMDNLEINKLNLAKVIERSLQNGNK